MRHCSYDVMLCPTLYDWFSTLVRAPRSTHEKNERGQEDSRRYSQGISIQPAKSGSVATFYTRRSTLQNFIIAGIVVEVDLLRPYVRGDAFP